MHEALVSRKCPSLHSLHTLGSLDEHASQELTLHCVSHLSPNQPSLHPEKQNPDVELQVGEDTDLQFLLQTIQVFPRTYFP